MSSRAESKSERMGWDDILILPNFLRAMTTQEANPSYRQGLEDRLTISKGLWGGLGLVSALYDIEFLAYALSGSNTGLHLLAAGAIAPAMFGIRVLQERMVGQRFHNNARANRRG